MPPIPSQRRLLLGEDFLATAQYSEEANVFLGEREDGSRSFVKGFAGISFFGSSFNSSPIGTETICSSGFLISGLGVLWRAIFFLASCSAFSRLIFSTTSSSSFSRAACSATSRSAFSFASCSAFSRSAAQRQVSRRLFHFTFSLLLPLLATNSLPLPSPSTRLFKLTNNLRRSR